MARAETARRSRDAAAAALATNLRASKVRLAGVAAVCASVAVVPLVFDPSLDWPFTVSKSLVGHALSYALAGIIAALFIRFGQSFFLWSWMHIPVLVFLAANVAATIWAADHFIALYGTHVRMLGLGTIADWVLLYFAVVLLVRTRAETVAVISCGLGASILVLAYELVQLLGRDPLNWNMDVVTRPISTIGQPTSLAQYLMVLAVGAVSIGLLIPGMPRRARALVLVLSGLLLAGAGATGTRSAVLGLVAGSAALVVLMWTLHPSRWARVGSLIGAGAAMAALGALLVWTPLGTRFAATFAVPPGDDASDEPLARFESSAEARTALYGIAFDMLRERPVFGFGPDNFVVGVPRYRAERSPYEIRQSLATSAHGWVTQIAATSGLAGLGSFLAIAASALALTLRKGFRPLAITGAAMLAAFLGTGLTTISDVGTDWLFWAAAGMIAATTAHPLLPPSDPMRQLSAAGAKKSRQANRDSQLSRVASAVCVGVALVVALTPASAWDASRSFRSSEQSRLQGKTSEAVALAVRAISSDPNRAEYWHGLGLAQLAASRFRDASAAFEHAGKQAPYDVRYLGDFARALLLLDNAGESGARDRAITVAEQAVHTDPNNPLAHLTRAVVMQYTGKLPDAMRSIDRALALDPQSGNAPLYVTASQIYLAGGRPNDAIRIARLGITFISPPVASLELRVQLARALVAVGQPTDALTELEAALAIRPGYVPAQQLRAEIRAGR